VIAAGPTVNLDPSFVVVYPHDFVVPESLVAALASLGIPHRSGSFPATTTDDGTSIAYLVEAERLAALGPRELVEHALALIEGDMHATTIVVADPGASETRWLADSPHVGGWLVRPLDPAAVIAMLRSARALVLERADARRRSRRSATCRCCTR
jgi:hypothetical protein